MEEYNNEQPSEPAASLPVVEPTKNKKPTKKLKVLSIALVALIIAIVAAFVILHKRTPTPAKLKVPPVITYYYNDGKTQIFQDKSPATYTETTVDNLSFFVGKVRSELETKYGKTFYDQGAWDVVTTLDNNLQSSAEKYVTAQETTLKKYGADAAGFVGQDVVTGKIVSWVSNFPDASNVAKDFASAAIEPGSSIKPFVYATLFDKTTNTGAGTQIVDDKAALEGYPCTDQTSNSSTSNCLYDYDRTYIGPMSIRYALGASRNVPVVKAANIVGIKTVQDTIKAMGATSGYKCYEDATKTKEGQCYQAATLGDGSYINLSDEVASYATMSRNGSYIPTAVIDKVTLNGTVKSQWSLPKDTQAIKADAAYITSDILSDPNASYFSTAMKAYFISNGFKVSIKPGTTNRGNSGSMFAYTTQYAAGFWYGRTADENKIQGQTENNTLPVVTGWLGDTTNGKTIVERVKPSGLQTLPAFITTKSVVGQVTPSPSVDIYPSYYKQ